MERKNRLRNITIGITVVIALFLALGNFSGNNEAVENYAQTHIHPLEAETLARLINNNPKPTLVFFYATWCPYCKDQFKELDTLAPLLVEKNVQKIFIAVDKNKKDVAKFMLNAFPQVTNAETRAFTPYWLPAENVEELHASLKARNLTPKDTIPYLIVFSPFGNNKQEFHGLTEHYRLSNTFNALNTD